MQKKNLRLGFDDRRVEQLLSDLRRVQYLREQRRPAEALEACLSVIDRAAALGIESPDANYMAARAAIHADNLEAALSYAIKAVAADPLSTISRDSLDGIAERVRSVLSDSDNANPATPRLYDLLVRARKADSKSHVAMARFFWHNGQAAEAASLLDAVTKLSPNARDAWALRAELALAQGDTALAAKCAAAAAGGSSDPAPLILPLAKA